MYSGYEALNAHNSLLTCAMQLKQAPFNFSFCLLSDGLLFPTYFSDPPKKTLDYSLWFLQNFDETMTAGGGGNLPPLVLLKDMLGRATDQSGSSIGHVVSVVVAVSTEVHAAGHTRERPLFSKAQSALVSILLRGSLGGGVGSKNFSQ